MIGSDSNHPNLSFETFYLTHVDLMKWWNRWHLAEGDMKDLENIWWTPMKPAKFWLKRSVESSDGSPNNISILFTDFLSMLDLQGLPSTNGKLRFFITGSPSPFGVIVMMWFFQLKTLAWFDLDQKFGRLKDIMVQFSWFWQRSINSSVPMRNASGIKVIHPRSRYLCKF